MSAKQKKSKSKQAEDQLKKIEELKQLKRRKKQLKEQQQRDRKLKEEQAASDREVELIYKTGLADAYKYFVQQAYREEAKFNIFEYAAQKILKFEKLRKQKEKKLSYLSS